MRCLAEGWSAPPCHGCFQAVPPALSLTQSGNLESGLLLQGDLIALWHSPGTFKLFKRLTLPVCAVMLVERLTGPGKWMGVGSVFVFKHLIACML